MFTVKKEIIYFDSAAAAQPDEEDVKFFAESLAEDFANQEAAHSSGYRLRKRIAESGERLSAALTGSSHWIPLWCSGGTEAFNLFAACAGDRKIHAVSSRMEHPALIAALKRLDPGLHLLKAVPETGKLVPEKGGWNLAAFHFVQSETGALQEPEKLFDCYPEAIHLLDAVQGACKLEIPPANTHILAVSGNKFGAPGCAALLLNPDWKGADAFAARAVAARRSGYLTGRVLPAAVFTCAYVAEKRRRSLEEKRKETVRLNKMIREACPQLGLIPTLPLEHTSPYILHLRAPGFQGGVLVRMLSEEGVMLSSGSACASETDEPSPALTALGFGRRDAFSGLRISFGFHSTADEVKKMLSSLEKVLKKY